MIKTIVKGLSISLLCSTLYANAGSKNNSNNLYVRAGTGLSFDNARFRRSSPFDNKAPRPFPTFHIGVGYKVNDSLRTDLTLQYAEVRYRAVGTKSTGTRVIIKQTTRTYAAFINGYYSANCGKIDPYLTAGIGVGHNRTENVRIDRVVVLPRGTSRTNFIWNVGAGVQFKANKNFALDLGYRYIDLGTARTLAGGRTAFNHNFRNKIRGHNVIGSLIYKF
jgi:opacity protein-like surface antigen